MNDHPILFSGSMVQAIFAGRKTQTRRVIRPQPAPDVEAISEAPDTDPIIGCMVSGHSGIWEDEHGLGLKWRCPYGVPGDQLWVKETFAIVSDGEKDGKCFRADMTDFDFLDRERGERWTPSILMPKRASRLRLDVIRIRVQRLQDIDPKDAVAEGVPTGGFASPLREFEMLWDTINSRRGFGWKANPWVWAVTFRAIL
jgi:hypothetical protein